MSLRVPPALAEVPGVVGVGLDLVDVDRLRIALSRTPSLERRVFSVTEREWCATRRDPVLHLAARFAAKEATLKALRLGLFDLALTDVEVLGGGGAPPSLELVGAAAGVAGERGITGWLVSLSHDAGMAGAVVVAVAG